MNYFAPNTAAERYSKGRPNFHSNSVKHIGNFLALETKLAKALDVACGTGLSTAALLEIAKEVYGTDASQAMLNFALNKDRIKYSLASAEQQPFESTFFDLITVCSGVHWFDIDRFLAEAYRLLKSKGWLVLYDNFFIGEMENAPEFKTWYNLIYLKKFPAPKRNDQYDWTKENVLKNNFDFVKEETFTNPVSFTKKELTLYFTTQSNIISVVEKNKSSYEEIERWLDTELSDFFSEAHTKQVVDFGNWIKYLQAIK